MRSRVISGVADQLVSSGSNYLCAFIASLMLVPQSFGAFVAAFAVVTVLSATARALVGDPLIAALPTATEGRRGALGASAIAASGLTALGSAVMCIVGGILLGGAIGAALLALAGWVPAAIIVDACRYVLLARSETASTLLIDSVWAIGQIIVLGVLLATGAWSVSTIAASWGLGAMLALAVSIVVVPEARVPAVLRPVPWLRESRALTGWFTLTSVLGQSQTYLVLLLAGVVLSARDVAGLRAVQLLVFQPPITFMGALLVLTVPLIARLDAAHDAKGVRRIRRVGTTSMAALSGLLLVIVPLRDPLLGLLFPRYLSAAPLVLPIVLQTVIAAFSVPLQAEVRGTRRGGALFGIQVVSAAALVGGAAAGAAVGGSIGLAWGLAASSIVTLIAFIGVSRARSTAMRRTAYENLAATP